MLAITLLTLTTLMAQGPDRDGDGLSDFHELHKYMTDPDAADSDGDGTPDGDWFERREFAYTVRSVVHVVPVPVTPDVLCDDYQDARVLDRQATYIELEVIHYPLNTVASAIKGDPRWREHLAGFEPYLQPGASANWDGEMRAALIEALAKDGIDVLALDDVSLVRQAAAWLMRRAKHRNLYTTFSSELGPDGSLRMHPELAAKAESKIQQEGLTVGQAMQRELFAKGMFENASRGSCTSSAIYLNGCLRALGIPTRIVLTIPVIDASDKREHAFVERLTHAGVRRTIQNGTSGLGSSWASHTYNEVHVGGRWRRLNYDKLGQNILDPDFFGLMTHVSTVSDWLDGGFAQTIGVRQQRRPDDIFGGSNPYSCISLSDQFGEHCELSSPPEVLLNEHATLTFVRSVARAVWSDDPGLPKPIREMQKDLRLFIEPAERTEKWEDFKAFTARVDRRFYLEAPGQPRISLTHGVGGLNSESLRFAMLHIGSSDLRNLRPGVSYTLRARNAKAPYLWAVPEGLTIRR